MNVLSLFDGISCGKVALDRANKYVENYYSSEINKVAIKVSKSNHKDIYYLGCVKSVSKDFLPKIDLLIGGSPCQDFSIANNERNGLNGVKSSLFFEYLRLKNELKPRFFLLENVVMDKTQEDIISSLLGVRPILIDSIHFSYQSRKRLYWTNIPILPWEHNDFNFQDFKSKDKEYCSLFKVKRTPSRERMWGGKCPNVTYRKKINCLTRKQDRWGNSGLVEHEGFCRYLTTNELEEAQNLPKGYCNQISKIQAEDVLGNGWTVNVIAHIFKGLN